MKYVIQYRRFHTSTWVNEDGWNTLQEGINSLTRNNRVHITYEHRLVVMENRYSPKAICVVHQEGRQ